MKLFGIVIIVGFCTVFSACEGFLDEPVYSQLAPENLLTTEEGMINVLYSAYSEAANMNGANSKTELAKEEWPTDILWQTGGGENAVAVQLINFSWDPGLGFLYGQLWAPYYRAIRNANVLLDNIDNLDSPNKELLTAEARFVRAISYINLYSAFGPVPIRRSELDEPSIPRPSEQDMQTFIETELLATIAYLPRPGEESVYGRANVGAVYGYLCKFYLNTKQWQKSADAAQDLIDLGFYGLYEDYFQLFKVENERNQEFVWVKPAFPSADRATANDWMNGAFPVGFARDPRTGLEFRANWVVFPSEYRLRDNFYNSFHTDDKRKDLIITSFINTSGATINLLGNDNTRSFKYWPDPNAAAQAHGNDIPVIRYADILLSRAEALSEINGPNQESVDLINLIRGRANVPLLELADFGTTELLREHLLKERSWELYSEGKRREDMIRMDVFVSAAVARGITNAKSHHVRFPIPQQAMDSDMALEQNLGY